jgi:hypothetical protein
MPVSTLDISHTPPLASLIAETVKSSVGAFNARPALKPFEAICRSNSARSITPAYAVIEISPSRSLDGGLDANVGVQFENSLLLASEKSNTAIALAGMVMLAPDDRST